MRGITPLYAGLLGLGFIALSVLVIRARGRARVSLGTGGDAGLERAVRAHGNFAEYAPFALLLMLAAELSGAPGWLLHLAGLLLLLGRLSHAVALSGPGSMPLRAGGMALTFAALVTLSLACLATALR
ncbi:hypothetical protein EAH89_12930 [Roseomonas nepalensis]|uniref:Glutathione metabolism protein n=1 Tax=Muricoccus nepalensis TaxID=1854500 RepID=A0A502G5X4_9PROT|nr:MAPEG family protein [Roseomonas nepalensis]TPG56961.1 hypothetical protein EAH89_12930 [Roseomonas nepalensis]